MNTEPGAASILIGLSGGTIVVTHGEDGTELAKLAEAPEGTWDALWDALGKLGFKRTYGEAPASVLCTFELDPDNGEATGAVHYFCSEDCRRSADVPEPKAHGVTTDHLPGTVCDHCGKELPT